MTKSIDVLPTWYWPDGVVRYLTPPRGSAYSNMVARWARRTPDAVAVSGTTSLTFAQLDEKVSAVGSGLSARLGDADSQRRIAVVDAADVDTVVAVLAGLYAGCDVIVVATAGEAADDCGLVVAGDGSGVGPAELAADGAGRTDEPGRGRVGLKWGDSIVFHPDPVLAGWGMAFRAFMQLDSQETFVAMCGLGRWEGMVGLTAPLMVGATCVLPGSASPGVAGALVPAADLDGVAPPGGWLLASVEMPLTTQGRRRLARRVGRPVRTVVGTAATGPIAATPKEWSIDAAVGIPFVGIDVIPLDDHLQSAVAPWHLLTASRVGIQSTITANESAIEGPRANRSLDDGTVFSGYIGQMDANGFLYLRAGDSSGVQ